MSSRNSFCITSIEIIIQYNETPIKNTRLHELYVYYGISDASDIYHHALLIDLSKILRLLSDFIQTAARAWRLRCLEIELSITPICDLLEEYYCKR